MERSEQLRIVEALVVGAPDPLPAARIAAIVPGLDASDVRRCVDELNAVYEEQARAFEIWEVAGGFQLRTRPVYAGYLQQLAKDRPLRLSRAALETLAVIAYKQPATRAEVEHVRGVDVGAVLRGLVERHLVRVAGHREVPGRPILYGTTRRFLEIFGLASLKDLPTLRELQELVPPEADDAPEAAAEALAPEPPSEADASPPEVLH
ncbi:MAG: SMC-Scp complex subunit ScpB [Myxococcota bacterium]